MARALGNESNAIVPRNPTATHVPDDDHEVDIGTI